MLRLATSDPAFERKFARLVDDRRESGEDVSRVVSDILPKCASAATRRSPNIPSASTSTRFRPTRTGAISPAECAAAFAALDPALRDALELAAARIRAYHLDQLPRDRDFTDDLGIRLGAKWRAVDAAGLYVPGGRAAYPSSLLMNAIPAKVAGVERLVVATPTPRGEVNPLVLAAAHLVGSTKSGASAGRRRSPRSPTAPSASPRSTWSPGRATTTSPRPSANCSAWSASTWSPARARSSSSPTTRTIPTGSRPTC
jgi:histidinol dehydrogenase